MKIVITRAAEKITNSEIRYCVKWFAEKLLPTRHYDKLQLRINIQHFPILDENKKDVLLGSMVCREKNKFTFNIDGTISKRQIIRTLAHELVHVKDMMAGTLVDVYKNQQFVYEKWRGEIIDPEVDYYDKPHEIEAFGREEGLYRRYIEHKKQKRLEFQ